MLAPALLPTLLRSKFSTQAPVYRKLNDMPTLQEQFDDAMFEFSTGNIDGTIARLNAILAEDPGYFDAQLALGGAYYAKGDYAAAIAEGHKAEKMKPHDQLAHTNLSRAYMKAGDKKTAEHHGLQARIASWRGDMAPPGAAAAEPALEMAKPQPPPMKAPEKFPDMPWKKKTQ
jgi:tetratricopeptide (TPR) repeat protein